MHSISPETGYLIGTIISIFLLGYLVYSMAKPDKF